MKDTREKAVAWAYYLTGAIRAGHTGDSAALRASFDELYANLGPNYGAGGSELVEDFAKFVREADVSARAERFRWKDKDVVVSKADYTHHQDTLMSLLDSDKKEGA